MKCKRIAIVILLSLMLVLSGCSNSKQIHQRLIIQGIAIDKVMDEYNVTVQIFDTKGESNDGEDSNTMSIMESRGRSVADAFEEISKQSGRKPLYSQNLMIVVGEDTAKDGIENVLNFFVRYYESRPSVNLFISKGQASDILTYEKDGEIVPAKDISMLAKNGKVSAASFNSTLLDFATAFEGGIKDAGACLLTKDDQNIKTSGTAVFEKDKLSGFLNERETKGSLLLNKEIKNLEETVAIEGIGKVSYDIISSKSKAKVRIEDNKPIFDIDICANISILEIAKEPNKELKEKDFDNINNKIQEQIRSLVSESINKTVFEYNSDIFNFTKLIKNNQTSYFRTIESNPKETLKKSSYNVNVKSKIKKIGQESDLV